MQISRSTYCDNVNGRENRQLQNDLVLRDMIFNVHKEFPGYGYRTLRKHFLRTGLRINAKRIRRVMKKFKIFTTSKPKFKIRGSVKGNKLVFPNLIHDLEINGPNHRPVQKIDAKAV